MLFVTDSIYLFLAYELKGFFFVVVVEEKN